MKDMKAAVISLGSKSSQMVITAMKEYFTVVDAIDLRSIEVNLGIATLDALYEGSPIQKYDCIYARGSYRYAPLLRSLTSVLADTTYLPVRCETFTIGHDKLLTHLALQQAKIPMPLTYLTSSAKAAKKILNEINYPIVVKFPHGTQGKGVMFAESYAAASSMLDALFVLKQPFLIQEYIETGGVDTRAFVVGDRVIASMKRHAIRREMRSNIHTGGKGVGCTLDTQTKNIALGAARSIGADICGVDILDGPKGPMVIEVNLSPGLRGISSATGINCADKIARYLFEKARQFSKRGVDAKTSEIMHDLGVDTQAYAQHIIANINFRGDRILLPKIVSDLAKFTQNDEVIIKAEEGKIEIEKSG